MSNFRIKIEDKINWVGYCPACQSWRHNNMAKQQGDNWFCTKRINFYPPRGDAQLYVRENLEQFDNLGWDRRINGCGIELLSDDNKMGTLVTYRDYTDFRDM